MNLDSLSAMRALDKEGVYLSICSLPDQLEASWVGVPQTKLLPEYKMAKNVVVAGMGGSALGARAIKHAFFKSLRVPIEIVNGYSLPEFVNEHTLVILSSYSGNTEETLSQAAEAKEKGAMVYGITTGGKLAKFVAQHEYPSFIFDPKYNPSGQPRMAFGYSFFALLSLFSYCGFLSIDDKEIKDAIVTTREFVQNFSAREPKSQNLAKVLAYSLKSKLPILLSSEHLFGIAHTFKNQINENAKTFSMSFDIPEMNHHLTEGLRFPPQASEFLHVVLFSSKLYSPRVSLRYPITQDILKQNNYEYTNYELTSGTRLEQVCEMMTLGAYVSFYMAMLYEIDPTPIPSIDYIKSKLA